MPASVDPIDVHILAVLQEDAGISNSDLAEKVGLSPAPCWRRVKRLEESGIIDRRVTLLDPQALGLAIVVYASVKLTHHNADALSHFESAVMAFPEVTECYTVSGGMDFLLRVVTTGMRSYETFLREQILHMPGVSEIHSRFVVNRVKHTTALPLKHLTSGDS